MHIGIFGRRNAGKSSLLNAITRQQVSIVSARAGTTTDPVEKPIELLPLGPVLFIDTAGIDDGGALGELRVAKTRSLINRTDLAVVVSAGGWSDFEEQLLAEFNSRAIPVVVVFNKCDLMQPPAAVLARLAVDKIPAVRTVATTAQGLLDLRRALLDSAPPGFLDNPIIIRDLVGPGELAVLVMPIDKEAPRGRLILPQAQTVRDLLDGGALSLVTQVGELGAALSMLTTPPKLVVTDSQAFKEVAQLVPAEVPLTSFSILFSRCKGDLPTQVAGAMEISRLRPGDRVLVAEACSHHPIEDDIGRVKIPRWLSGLAGGPLRFDTVQGHDFPADVSEYRLVVHCGACMQTRREVLSHILQCRAQGVPITNYGLAISYSLGIFERALRMFPEVQELLPNTCRLPAAVADGGDQSVIQTATAGTAPSGRTYAG